MTDTENTCACGKPTRDAALAIAEATNHVLTELIYELVGERTAA